jgi:hydrogenase maturation protein HypF
VLTADLAAFQRRAHLAYVPMPGGTAAIKEPWRMALSYLESAYGEDAPEIPLPLLDILDTRQVNIVRQMIHKGLNAPLTSSLGRLFDGVAAIVGLKRKVAFEGQAAMLLEMAAGDESGESYPYEWLESSGIREIDPAPIIQGVVGDLLEKRPTALISARFHRTLIRLFTDLCRSLRSETDLDRVALSGGVFQNNRLWTGLMAALQGEGFTVYTHRQVPANDGGISLGQAVVAAST